MVVSAGQQQRSGAGPGKHPGVHELTPTASYLICTTPRTGGTLLAEMLERTGVAGVPKEYYLSHSEGLFRRQWGLAAEGDDAAFIERAARAGCTRNGVFGAKISWPELTSLLNRLDGAPYPGQNAREVLERAFVNLHFVWLTRRDVARQAISFARAVQTGRWAEWAVPTPEGWNEALPPAEQAAPRFDFDQIAFFHRQIVQENGRWERFFAEAGLEPARFVYEDVVADGEREIRRFLATIGVDAPSPLFRRKQLIKRQSDTLSEEWLAEYERERRARRRPPSGDHEGRPEPPSASPPSKYYLICSSPRAGGYFLCDVLDRTGAVGHPGEYYLRDNEQPLRELWEMSPQDDESAFLARVLKEGSTDNGVFGARIHWAEFEDLAERLAAGAPDSTPLGVLDHAFPEVAFVWLRRRDVVRQAVSFSRAVQTDDWMDWRDESDIWGAPRPPRWNKEPAYDFDHVDWFRRQIERDNENWSAFFTASGAHVLELLYEDVVADPEGQALRVLQHLGVPAPVPLLLGESRLRKQGDALSEAWVKRYEDELRLGAAEAALADASARCDELDAKYQVLAQRVAGMRDELAVTRDQNQVLRSRNQELEIMLVAMLGSISWRLTEPLRKVRSRVRRTGAGSPARDDA